MAEPKSCCRLMLSSCAFLVAFLVLSFSLSAADAGGSGDETWLSSWMAKNQKTACRGTTIAECIAGGEFEMDSEINRRMLATSRYISYGAMQRDSVPCSERGASYYNCQPGGEANPYIRGCNAITRCRS